MKKKKIQNIIPVALATMDDFYVNYLYITMLSAVINAENTTFYKFCILVSGDFSAKTKAKLKQLEKYHNCSVSFYDMQEAFIDAYKTHEHINYATYYRLLLPEVLPDVEKCIYLDSDIIVNGDLSKIYNTKISDSYLAGVRAAGYCSTSDINAKRLLLPECKNYINAGVLLMNLQKIRLDNIHKSFINLMHKKYRDQDQDILNVSCYGKIKILPLKCNHMTPYYTKYEKFINMGIYSRDEVDEACKNPLIIHYADKIKPWKNPDMTYGKLWWKYAKMTPFYKKLKKSLNSSICKECKQPEQVKTVLLFSFIPLLKIKKYNRKTQCLFLSFIPLLEKKEKNNKIIYKIFSLFPVLKCNIKGE